MIEIVIIYINGKRKEIRVNGNKLLTLKEDKRVCAVIDAKTAELIWEN